MPERRGGQAVANARPMRGQDPERKRGQLLRPNLLPFALVLYVAVGRCAKTPEGLKFIKLRRTATCQKINWELHPRNVLYHSMFCFVIVSSCLRCENKIYCQTSTETFIPILNVRTLVASKKCFVKTTDIVIDPLSEYLNNDFNPYGKKTCQTCNQSISDHSFKSNLTGKEYKTATYDKFSFGSSNIIYGIHCIHCGLVYVGETGRSLRSRAEWPQISNEKGGQSLLHRHFHQPNLRFT